MGKAEAYVEKYLLSECKKMGYRCYKLNFPATTGAPDRLVIGHGRVIFVETKRSGKEARRRQLMVHNEMTDQGAEVFVTDTREDVDRLLIEIYSQRDTSIYP